MSKSLSHQVSKKIHIFASLDEEEFYLPIPRESNENTVSGHAVCALIRSYSFMLLQGSMGFFDTRIGLLVYFVCCGLPNLKFGQAYDPRIIAC